MKTTSETRQQVYWIIAVVLLTYLPFVKQPFHLDDYLYIDVAKNVFRKPLFPQDMPYVFEGKSAHGQWTHDMGSHSHPPFASYFIAGMMALFNQRTHLSEIGFHLGFLIFPLMLGVSALFLARRFTAAPALAAAWIMVTPVVMTISHILSPDIMTLAFWVMGVTAFIYALDTERHGLLWLSAIATSLAVFTSYQALSMVGLFLLYATLQKKLDRRACLVSLAPVLVLVVWFLLGYVHFGRFLPALAIRMAAEQKGWGAERSLEKILGALIDLGGATAFPVFILALLSGWLRGRVMVVMGLISIFITVLVAWNYSLWQKAMMFVFLTAGLLLFTRILARGWTHGMELRERASPMDQAPASSRDGIFLSLWVLGVFTYCIILFFTFAARYILPMVPPLMLFLVNETKIRYPHSQRFLIGGVLATLVFSVLYSVADYQFASVYPKIAGHLKSTYGKAGQKLWYAGEWGFRYYCEDVGAEILVTDTSAPRGGDMLVVPELASGYPASQDIESMLIPVEHLSYKPKLPLRLLDRFSQAGFPGIYRGLLPISFSRRPLEEVTVKQVSLLVDQLPEARINGEEVGQDSYPTLWTLGGESKLTLQQAPNSSLAYAMRIPTDAQLAFSLGATGGNMERDNQLTFSLLVKASGHGQRLIFTRTLSVRGATPSWVPEAVNLSDYAGQSMDLTLRLTADVPGPVGPTLRGGWGGLVLIPQQISTR